MTIGTIQTPADLDRFINERLAELQVGDIGGLSDALAAGAAGKVERIPAAENVELLAEEVAALPGILFTADVKMSVYASAIFDIEGGAIFGQLLVNGVAEAQVALGDQDATSRGTFAQDFALELEPGDVVTLAVAAPAEAEGKVYGGQTALTIVRIS